MTLYVGTRPATIDEIKARIVATKAALDGARAAWRHSPNATTEAVMARVEARLNDLLEQIPRQETACPSTAKTSPASSTTTTPPSSNP